MLWPILLTLSFIGIVVLLGRAYFRVKRDEQFQEHLAEEEQLKKVLSEEEIPEPASKKEKAALQEQFEAAEEALSQQDYPSAEAIYLAILEEDRTHHLCYVRLGLISMNQGDFKAAELHLIAANNLNPEAATWIHLAEALLAQDRLMEAAEAYEAAYILNERQNELIPIIGELYQSLENHEKAAVYLEKALKLDPQNNLLREALIREFEASGQWEQALRYLKGLLGQKPYDERLRAWK